MDSRAIPLPSKSDPASVDTLSREVGSPAFDPVTQPPAGMNAPEKKVEETTPVITDRPTGNAGAAVLSSSQQMLQAEKSNSRRDRDENDVERSVWDLKRMRQSSRLQLFSLDEDPDQKTATTDIKDLNWLWPAYDQVYDQLGLVIHFLKRGKAPKSGSKVSKGFPFQVVYRSGPDCVLWPDSVLIKLKSSLLMAILSEYLPQEKDLRRLNTMDLLGRRLYPFLDKLKQHHFRSDADPNPSTISAATISAVVSPTEEGPAVTPNDQNGASNGVSNEEAILATASPETQSHDLASPSEDSKNQEASGETLEEARLHLFHLVRFLEDEYTVVALRQQHMKEDKSVSFDMLWTFLAPGTTVVYQCIYSQEQLCAKVLDNTYLQSLQFGKVFIITLAIWDYNGVVYRQCSTTRTIVKFSGEKPFDTLDVRPIDMDRTSSAEALMAEFLAKGRRFQELAMRSSTCFMHYDGALYSIRNKEIVKEKADGRVMIDLRSFAVMNPNHPMRTAQPPVASSAVDDLEGNGNRSSMSIVHQQQTMMSIGHQQQTMMMAAAGRPNIRRTQPVWQISDNVAEALAVKSSENVDDENLVLAPAIVYGFSFTLKQWGAFSVTGFSDIDFHTTAFDALVMDPELKTLLYSLVSQFIGIRTLASGPSPKVDPIANKGEGCVFLCYGPPGTGKTLTAESLAEILRRPLWALSVAELGTTPGDLEKTLMKILEIAATWKAVLLLDEADVYLEKRVASTDLMRNAMTGVFLRLLEYYKGVLFLTTNRITTFDDAFRSRISLVLCYPKLDQEKREQIWRTALARVQAGKEEVGEGMQVGPEFLADMARHPINGREIRNAIHIAQTLARNNNEELKEQHLRLVMGVVTKTTNTLDAALLDA